MQRWYPVSIAPFLMSFDVIQLSNIANQHWEGMSEGICPIEQNWDESLLNFVKVHEGLVYFIIEKIY